MWNIKVVKIASVLVGLSIPCAYSKSYVYLKNQTGRAIEVSGHVRTGKLDSKAYSFYQGEVSDSSKAKIASFNRDSGIKHNKGYLLESIVRLAEENCEISLFYYLRGKMIHSHMWQGARGNATLNPGFDQGRKFLRTFSKCDKGILSVRYKALSTSGDDDLYYQVEFFPYQELLEESFKLMSYNIYMRPTEFFRNYQEKRIQVMVPALLERNRDVFVISEAFDDDIRAFLLKSLAKHGYVYSSEVVGRDVGFKQDGGVIIISRLPIVFERELTFKKTCRKVFEDCMSQKGAMLVGVQKGKETIYVVGTHLEADATVEDKRMRAKQLKLIKDFVDEQELSPESPLVYAGDFNIRHNEEEFLHMQNILYAQTLELKGDLLSVEPTLNTFLDGSNVREHLDHILYSLGHKAPKEENFYTKRLLAPPLLPFPWSKDKDLSDHFPVEADLIF